MEINGATHELPWQELRGMKPEELMRLDWLQKKVQQANIDDLKNYNPAIESIMGLIKGTRGLSADPKQQETLKNFEYLLEKEKTFALINQYEKESSSKPPTDSN